MLKITFRHSSCVATQKPKRHLNKAQTAGNAANVRYWRKADIRMTGGECPLLTQSGHPRCGLSGEIGNSKRGLRGTGR
jgi:hypothetical protein